MKKQLYLLALIFFFGLSYSQAQELDRSKAPQPGPAPKINIGKYKTFTLKNGLTVFVVENSKLPVVTYRLNIDIDPIKEGEKAGYVSMAGSLLQRGTTTRSKQQIDEEADFIGATVSSYAQGVFGSSLKKHEDKLLELLSDIVLNPTFPESELEKIKKRTKSGLAADKDDPNSIASNVSNVLVFGKAHPYGELTTEQTVDAITIQDCEKYYETYFKPSKAYLAVVGDVNFKETKKLVTKYFGAWESGEIPTQTYPEPQAPKERIIALVDKPGAVQSVIRIGYPLVLKPGTSESMKTGVMNTVLGGGGFNSRLMQNIREDKAYTYGARSGISSSRVIGKFTAYASVRTEVTDSAIHEFLYEMERIVKEPVTDKELSLTKNRMAGSFARSLENAQTIASFAINTALYNLSDDYYQNYLTKLDATSKEDVAAMAKKYVLPENCYIVVVGDAEALAGKFNRFGKVIRYDIEGNEVDMTKPNVSAKKVFEKYIDAIGGAENVSKVKAVKSVSATKSMMGEMNFTLIRKAPYFMSLEMAVGGRVMSQQIVNDKKAAMIGMGQRRVFDDAKVKELQEASYLFEELTPNLFKAEVLDVRKINGEEAYVVRITYASGNKKLKYYSKKSGLLLQEEATEMGKILYADYQATQDVLFPRAVTTQAKIGTFEAKVKELVVNPELPENIFSIEE